MSQKIEENVELNWQQYPKHTYVYYAQHNGRLHIKCKVCLVGDGGTGKTTLCNKTINGEFTREYKATRGAVVRHFKLDLDVGVTCHYEVWDTAGQEKHSRMRDCYYAQSHGAIIVFDLTSAVTLKNVGKHIKSYMGGCLNESPKIVVIGNKLDKCSQNGGIDAKQVAKVLRDFPRVKYYQVSAKTGFNFAEPFLDVAADILGVDAVKCVADLDLREAVNDYDFLDTATKYTDYLDQFKDFAPEE